MSGFGTWGETVTRGNSTPKRQKTSPFDEGSIHDPVSHQNRSDEIGKHIVCSSEEKRNIKKWYNDIVCHPIANALNPCEDVMGGFGPRFIIWIVWIITILGNTAVIAVLLVTNSTRMRVHNFLIVNLAIAGEHSWLFCSTLS